MLTFDLTIDNGIDFQTKVRNACMLAQKGDTIKVRTGEEAGLVFLEFERIGGSGGVWTLITEEG